MLLFSFLSCLCRGLLLEKIKVNQGGLCVVKAGEILLAEM